MPKRGALVVVDDDGPAVTESRNKLVSEEDKVCLLSLIYPASGVPHCPPYAFQPEQPRASPAIGGPYRDWRVARGLAAVHRQIADAVPDNQPAGDSA